MKTIAEQMAEERLRQYNEAAAHSAGADKAALAIAALEAAEFENSVSAKKKKWLYILSLSLPPIGLVFAAYYLFSSKNDAKRVAFICLLITVFGIVVVWGSVAMFYSFLPAQTAQQLQTLKPTDIDQLLKSQDINQYLQ